MSQTIFSCPQCGRQLRSPQPVAPGTQFRCPQCGNVFAAPAEAAAAPEAPAPLGEPLPSSYTQSPPVPPPAYGAQPPRFGPADESGYTPPPAYTPGGYGAYQDDPAAGGGKPTHELTADYRIDLGEWFRYAQAHYSAVLGPMIGFTVIYVVIILFSAVVNAVTVAGGSLVLFFIGPSLNAGFTIVSLAQLKGRDWTFGDFFAGFNWFLPLLLANLVLSLAALVCLAPGLILMFITLNQQQAGAVQNQFPALAFGVLAIGYLIMLFIFLRAGFFSTALIIDRKVGGVESLSLSWKLTEGHTFGILGVAIVLGLIFMGGYMACCVGLLFAVPFIYLTSAAGYLLIAGTRPPLDSPRGYGSEPYSDYRR